MKNKDEIKDLFSDKLGNFEAQVNPELWANIASKIGGSVAAGSTGLSILSKWLIGLGVSGAAVVSVVVLTSPEEVIIANTPIDPIIEQYKEKEEAVTTTEEESYLVQTGVVVNETGSETELEESNIELTVETEEAVETEGVGNIETEEAVETEEISNTEAEETVEIEEVSNTEAEETVETEESGNTQTEAAAEVETILVLPNFFSPNNDGDNDEFFIHSEGLSNFNIVILNDKNQTVYQSNDPNFIWRGLDLTGNEVLKGNYLYYITAEDSKGNPINKYSLLRINK